MSDKEGSRRPIVTLILVGLIVITIAIVGTSFGNEIGEWYQENFCNLVVSSPDGTESTGPRSQPDPFELG